MSPGIQPAAADDGATAHDETTHGETTYDGTAHEEPR